jgi:DNA-binding NarL/FixJ family response regulator
MSKRVVVCDDHPVVRSGIRLALAREPDIEIVGEAGNGPQAIRLVRELLPDVLVLDIEMPGMNGIEVTRAIREAQLDTRILILSAHDDELYVATLVGIGANGYLTKDEAHTSLVAAVRGVASGEEGWFSRHIASRVTISIATPRAKAGLTEREREVLERLVCGKTNQGIAHTLGISEKTVERHLGSLFEKLGVASRVEAAVRAVREGLV